MSSNTILVFSEKPALLRQLISEATRKAAPLGWRVAAVAAAKDIPDLVQLGEDLIYQVNIDLCDPEIVTASLTSLVAQLQPGLFLVGATKLGLEIGPRVAERTNAGYAAWAVGFELDASTTSTIAQCMLYTGTGVATYKFKPGTVILSATPNIFEENQPVEKTAEVIVADTPAITSKVTILEYKPKQSSGARLEEARLVVDVGQGMKNREDLQLVQELSGLLDGQLACSRPIASDRDWFPEWLGLSGAKIKPELCLTVGVSGAIQHIVGIRDSHLIAAINTDEGAAIFSQADYGVVADLYEFLPALTERIKTRGVRPAWMS